MIKSEKSIEWIENAIKIHGNKYNYEKTIYINAVTNLIITCKIHGDFNQRPSSHINGSVCKKCGILKMNQTNIDKASSNFIKKSIKIHGDKYSYSKVKYIHSQENVIITCKIHGDFEQAPYNHHEGKGCPKCSNKISKSELEIIDFIKK